MSYKSDKKIVELFGLPGSGKTSLFRRIKSNQINLSFAKSNFHGHKLFWLRTIFTESLKVRHLSLVRFKVSLLFDLYRKDFLEVDEYNIVDEGWLQRILSFYETKLDENEIEKAFHHVEIPDKVIILSREENGCFQRYNHSKNIRNRLGYKYLENWKEVIVHNFQEIKKYLRSKHVDFVDVDKDVDLDNLF